MTDFDKCAIMSSALRAYFVTRLSAHKPAAAPKYRAKYLQNDLYCAIMVKLVFETTVKGFQFIIILQERFV